MASKKLNTMVDSLLNDTFSEKFTARDLYESPIFMDVTKIRAYFIDRYYADRTIKSGVASALTRRTNNLWQKMREETYRIKKAGYPGIYKVMPHRFSFSKATLGYIHADSISDAISWVDTFFSCLSAGNTVHCEFYGFGNREDAIKLNKEIYNNIIEELEKRSKVKDSIEKTLTKYKANKTVLQTLFPELETEEN